MILKYLDASTSHLRERTFNKVYEDTIPYSYHYDEGVFISVPEDNDAELFIQLPRDLRNLLKYAWKHDIKLIRLDRDAEVVEGLPIYKWPD